MELLLTAFGLATSTLSLVPLLAQVLGGNGLPCGCVDLRGPSPVNAEAFRRWGLRRLGGQGVIHSTNATTPDLP